MKRPIGLHLRLMTTIEDLLQKALRIESPIAQCFFVLQSTHKYLEITEEDAAASRELAKKFDALYLHASYWVNLAGCTRNGWRPFMRELDFAKKFGFTHLIIHPGSATGCETKDEGIECLARALNKALKDEHEIKIVLENGAHANKTVGGDLEDFRKLRTLLDEPEKIYFCIDTAHAHSYGYDVVTPEGQDAFLKLMHECVGEQFVLLHLNETAEKAASRIDKHAAFGQGVIGNEALMRFMNHPLCNKVPVILEIPIMENEEQEKELLSLVSSWQK